MTHALERLQGILRQRGAQDLAILKVDDGHLAVSRESWAPTFPVVDKHMVFLICVRGSFDANHM